MLILKSPSVYTIHYFLQCWLHLVPLFHSINFPQMTGKSRLSVHICSWEYQLKFFLTVDENLCSSVAICRFWLHASTSSDCGRGVKCAVGQYLQITWFLGMNLCLFWTSHKLSRIYLVPYARIHTLESSYHCLILERNTGVGNSLCFLLPLLLLQQFLVAFICPCFFL